MFLSIYDFFFLQNPESYFIFILHNIVINLKIEIYYVFIYITNLEIIYMVLMDSRIKISVNTDISVIGFYGNIGNIENIDKISVDIFTHISVIKIFHILII